MKDIYALGVFLFIHVINIQLFNLLKKGILLQNKVLKNSSNVIGVHLFKQTNMKLFDIQDCINIYIFRF